MIPKTLAGIGIILALTSCASISKDGKRITAADSEWGVDVRLNDAKQIESVYIEGPADATARMDYAVFTGTSPDGRPYIFVARPIER
jgi:hypothetical protein